MDVGRVVPLKGELLALGHAPFHEQFAAHFETGEVREGDHRLARDAQDLLQEFARALDRLQRFAEHDDIEAVVRDHGQTVVDVFQQDVAAQTDRGDDLVDVDLDAVAAAVPALAQDVEQRAVAAAEVQHAAARRDQVEHLLIVAQLPLPDHAALRRVVAAGRVVGRRQKRAHHALQFFDVGQEGIVARCGVEVAVRDLLLLAHERGHKFFRLLGHEEPVTAQRDDQHARGDLLKSGVEAAVALLDVVLVHGQRDVKIGVGVEALDELLALVLQIALDLEEGAEVAVDGVAEVGIGGQPLRSFVAAEFGLHELLRKVGDVGQLARAGETLAGQALAVVVVSGVPVGIRDDRVTADNVEGEGLRVEAGSRGNHDSFVDLTGIADQPFEHLHAAEAAAHHRREPRDAELTQAEAVHLDNIPHRDFGEGGAVGFAGFRIDRGGACCALASSKDIGANDLIAPGVDAFAGADHAFPPTRGVSLARPQPGDMGVAGERVADKDHVVVVGGDRAAALDRDFDFR